MSISDLFKSSPARPATTQLDRRIPISEDRVPSRENSIDRNLSAEELDSDDLDGDLNLSDDENGAAARGQFRQRKSTAKKQHYATEFDTNIFKVSLDCL